MKIYEVRILSSAQNELDAIGRVHLELVGPISARRVTDKIYDAIEKLKNFPLLGVMPGDRQLREAGYRFLISGKYICVYRLLESTVFVYHIVHGATDYPQILKDLPEKPEEL